MDGAVGFEPTKEPSKGSGLPLAYTPIGRVVRYPQTLFGSLRKSEINA